MNKKDIIDYVDTLDDMEKDDKWMPSPHHMDVYLEAWIRLSPEIESSFFFEIESRLEDHIKKAYEY